MKKIILNCSLLLLASMSMTTPARAGGRDVGNGKWPSMKILERRGIRDIGNGGGLAEMKTVLISKDIRMFWAQCFEADSICSMSPADKKLLALKYKSSLVALKVSFEPETDSTAWLADKLIISSDMLYEASGDALSFSGLLNVVTYVAIHGSQKIKSSVEVDNYFDFDEMKESESLGGDDFLHVIAIADLQKALNRKFLIYEKSAESYNLTALLEEKIKVQFTGCRTVQDYSIANSQLSSTGDAAYGDFDLTCGNVSYVARIRIGVLANNKFNIGFFAIVSN